MTGFLFFHKILYTLDHISNPHSNYMYYRIIGCYDPRLECSSYRECVITPPLYRYDLITIPSWISVFNIPVTFAFILPPDLIFLYSSYLQLQYNKIYFLFIICLLPLKYLSLEQNLILNYCYISGAKRRL